MAVSETSPGGCSARLQQSYETADIDRHLGCTGPTWWREQQLYETTGVGPALDFEPVTVLCACASMWHMVAQEVSFGDTNCCMTTLTDTRTSIDVGSACYDAVRLTNEVCRASKQQGLGPGWAALNPNTAIILESGV
jgi:hypothetical protein